MSVKKIVEHLNAQVPDSFLGYWYGLNAINEDKAFIVEDAIGFEKHRKQGLNTFHHMKNELILYYVSTDKDFDEWYVEHEGNRLCACCRKRCRSS